MVARWWEWLNADAVRRDLVVVAASFALGLALVAVGAVRLWSAVAVVDAPRWVFAILLGCMAAAATQRSRRPFLALTLGLLVAAVDLGLGGSLGVVLFLTDVVYAAVKYGRDRGVQLALRITLGAALLGAAALIVFRPTNEAIPIVVGQWALILAVSGAWGWNVRSAQRRTEAELREQHARLTEQLRHRIAHDLHDLVANQIAVAGLHVEAAKLQAGTAREDLRPLLRSLEQAKHGTDRAHLELRHLIEVLTAVEALDHTVGADEGLDELARLLPAGRELRWPAAGDTRLHALLARCEESTRHVLLRSLRELVANAAKHGRGAVTVDVVDLPEPRVTLTNDYAPSTGAPGASGLGIGGARLLLRGIGADLSTGPEPAADTPDRAGNAGPRWRATITLPASASDPTGPTAPTVATADQRSLA